MEAASEYRVVHVERLSGDIIIEFNDGECALYSPSLLHTILGQATKLDEPDLEED
jgi:hypothetical protein